MATKRELEQRIKELEYRIANLENKFDVYGRCYAITTDKIRKEIERYVQEHIWYTTVENKDAFEKGGRIKVLLKELSETLDPSKKSKSLTEDQEKDRGVAQWC